MTNQSAEIVSLALQRVPPKVIAQRLCVHPNTVYQRIREARQAGEVIPTFKAASKGAAGGSEHVERSQKTEASPSTKQIVVSVRLYSLLTTEADRRGLTPTEAAQRLLEKALLGTVTA
jgi:transposase